MSVPVTVPSGNTVHHAKLVVVDNSHHLLNWRHGFKPVWSERSIDVLTTQLQHFLPGHATDIIVFVAAPFEVVQKALSSPWAGIAYKLIVHGQHTPCGEIQNVEEAIPGSRHASWLPTVHVVTLTYTDTCNTVNYEAARKIAIDNLREGRPYEQLTLALPVPPEEDADQKTVPVC